MFWLLSGSQSLQLSESMTEGKELRGAESSEPECPAVLLLLLLDLLSPSIKSSWAGTDDLMQGSSYTHNRPSLNRKL